jgi:acyl-CoA synthetase (AMP-forming)/AMP-acid ligase II
MKKLKVPNNSQQGYIALLAVLIMGAASLAIALSLLIGGADNEQVSLITQQSIQARNLATACAEEALQQIHDNTAFTGTNNLTLGQGTCTYTVTNTGGSNRTVDATGSVNTVARKVKVYVTIGASNISITSWQDV